MGTDHCPRSPPSSPGRRPPWGPRLRCRGRVSETRVNLSSPLRQIGDSPLTQHSAIGYCPCHTRRPGNSVPKPPPVPSMSSAIGWACRLDVASLHQGRWGHRARHQPFEGLPLARAACHRSLVSRTLLVNVGVDCSPSPHLPACIRGCSVSPRRSPVAADPGGRCSGSLVGSCPGIPRARPRSSPSPWGPRMSRTQALMWSGTGCPFLLTSLSPSVQGEACLESAV